VERQKLFLPFRATKAKGLGLGLPIAKKIVEAHGGSIEVASRLHRGTTFTVCLPAVAPDHSPNDALQQRPALRSPARAA
jgi:signal transduction histidine kinase